MSECPDHSITQLQAMIFKDRIEEDVERKYLAVVDMVPDLPTNRSARMEKPDGFGER